MFQPSDVSLPRMNYNFSPPRPLNYGGPQNVTTSEANFISVDEGVEKVMQSQSQSEAQEESIQVSQKESINLDQLFPACRWKGVSHVNQ